LPHQHITPYGHHAFNHAGGPGDYRPLRTAEDAIATPAKTLNRAKR
jgi:hypothetical protein